MFTQSKTTQPPSILRKIRVSVSGACSYFDHTVWGCPSISAHLNAAGLRYSGPHQSARFKCCTTQQSGHRGNCSKPIEEGLPGFRRGPKAKQTRSVNSTYRSECPLPDFHLRAAIFNHTVRGSLFLPDASQLRAMPECEILMLRKVTPRTWRQLVKHQFSLECRDLQRGRRAKPPEPTDSIFRSDCYLPTIDSADRR